MLLLAPFIIISLIIVIAMVFGLVSAIASLSNGFREKPKGKVALKANVPKVTRTKSPKYSSGYDWVD